MAETNPQVYEIVHASPELTNVGEFIRDLSSPAFQYVNNIDGFLAVKQKDGRTNKEVIFASYTTEAQRKRNEKRQSKDYDLKVGTRLAVETSKVNRGALLTEGIEVVSNDIPAFKAQALADLESKEGYAVVDSLKPINGQIYNGITKEMYPDVTVWIWCKCLSDPIDAVHLKDDHSLIDAYQGQIFNITPFIQKLTTSVSKNGGNFNFTLPPLICELDQEGKWVIKPGHIQHYSQNVDLSLQGDGYIAEGSLYTYNQDEDLQRNQFLFHNMIGTNDLVFIRFETLQMEAEQRIEDNKSSTIDKSKLAGRIYDMIGLVDSNLLKVNPEGNDVTIDIQGRDLSKLFIEDGAYFYPIEFTQGKLYISGGATNPNNVMYRVNNESALYYLGLYFNNSLERIFKFVIQQLSTIKVCPDQLFEAWGIRRNKKFNPDKKQVGQYRELNEQLSKYEKEAKDAIGTARKENKLAFSSPTEEAVKIDEIFREQKRFQETIRTAKVRQVEGGVTQGWKPFKYTNERGVIEDVEESSFPDYFNNNIYNLKETDVPNGVFEIVSAVDKYIDTEKSQPQYKEKLIEEYASGIWQIIKLVIDKGVTGRRLIDSSISTASGSLLNFFNKVCQEPFVEFFMDTYGDQYHLIVRKPPYDRAGYLSMLKGSVTTEENGQERVTPAVIDIMSEDVLQETLSFDDKEAVSWYQLSPRAMLYGKAEDFALAYFPALFFPEYADIWGSKPMQLFHNYLPNRVLDPQTTDNIDIIEKQAFEDIRFMIESTAYLPFTRKGTLVLNGDRRLKYGNLIRYKPTGEVFFVDGVQQTYVMIDNSIERTTTVSVIRGMVEQFIYGLNAETKDGTEATTGADYISYFNIIETKPSTTYVDKEDKRIELVQVDTRVTTPASLDIPTVTDEAFNDPRISDQYIVSKINENMHELDKLGPQQKKIFTRFINAINVLTGLKVNITSGFRTYEEQVALYAQNSQNAKPGTSRHEFGNALDINLEDPKTGQKWLKKTDKQLWLDTGVPQLARKMGIQWAGGDGNFGSYIDRVHFQVGTKNNAVTEPVYEPREIVTKTRQALSIDLFNNFKVNKQVFDFFLRRQQMNKLYTTVQSDHVIIDPNDDRDLGGISIKG